MFINKTADGLNNICGEKISCLRISRGWSQRALAEKLQEIGLDIDKNAVQRIESRQRFVTDIELGYFARIFEVDIRELIAP